MAKAFAIGVKEATAVSCLTKVNPEVCELLRAAIRGMRPFLQHDVIAKECFNVGWSSGKISEFEAWRIQLTNTDELATGFLEFSMRLFVKPQGELLQHDLTCFSCKKGNSFRLAM